MGSAHNDSLDVGRGARNKASTRTPIHFYLEVPMYEYNLGCGKENHLHTFQSRTPVVAVDEEESCTLWCERCQNYSVIDSPEPEPMNKVVKADEVVAFEQDKGILRERIAWAVQDVGYLETDAQIADFAVRFGVPVGEIQKINIGLRAPEGLSGETDMCQAGLHEMTMDNIRVKTRANGNMFRICILCEREKNRSRMQKARTGNKRVRITPQS